MGGLELEKYKELRAIKTVEQDLPQDLLPLEIYYRYYWDSTDFKDFEKVFEIYWHEKLNPYIYNFIKKYFYGCSLQFVEEGFKARLYRI
ncbi:Type II restriction enzyme TthHB8I (endonuclease TthHB8I) (R.TthHB8I) [Hydrogenivirga sp. 128-5-R1-1]|nr:Type II restriction enzyme TthHB8I (endonuclease TthHB8I) (R.TthHB8I) [Hydrogenivirga sp. 128-5-R1-1]